jgi:hypothetical protein
MKHFYRYTLLFVLLFIVQFVPAQNITGTWEGMMPGEYLLVSIEQKGNELCGYTYDYELRNQEDHCIAAYVGRYDRERDVFYISGRSFIENSGTHVLMRLIMWQDRDLDKNTLKGKVYIQSGLSSFFGMDGEDIILRKTSSKPRKLPGGKPDCFPKPPPPVKPAAPPADVKSPAPKVSEVPVQPKAVPVQPKAVPVQPKTAPVQPKAAPPKPAPVPPRALPKPVPQADSVKKVTPSALPVTIKKPDADLMRKMNERKQQQQSRLEVNVKRINLKVYDNGVVDNDTVSIFYNGKLLLSHQRLSEQAIELNIDLDDNVTEHTITMFAENLGGIPPNTAVIIVTAGDKRYELRSKANLEENAVLVFDYKPKN